MTRRRLLRAAVLVLAIAIAAVFVTALLELPASSVRLAPEVDARLSGSGASHPVTAVLLNFRGYDTLLEIAVLLLALLGVLAAGSEQSGLHWMRGSPQPVLQSTTRAVAPLMVMVAGYLLWAGSHRPGGAFQAGAVLASAAVLLYLAGLLSAPAAPGRYLRYGLAMGFMIFLMVAVLQLGYGALLQYPPRYAGLLILMIESGLSLSLGLILAGLYLWLPNEDEEAEE